METRSVARWWGLRAAAGAALLCGVMVEPAARAQTATAPGNSSANPGTTPPGAGPGSRLDLPAETPGSTADSAASSLSTPAQTGNTEPHPVNVDGPVVRSIFDQTDVSDEHPVGEPADVSSSFDRQDSVNDHPVP